MALLALSGNGVTFEFSIGTAAYETISRSTSWEWPSLARVGAYPAHQYTGPAAETITLPGVIFPVHRPAFAADNKQVAYANAAGANQLDTLRAIAAKGEPLTLANNKKELGRWVITGITEEQSSIMSDGTPRKQTFTINLTRYD
ncbi:MAG: phage tail protein [Opitutaceae bacterium]|jgi:phage protein U|nr:phage tail protein [Opitutaceae bacterium]